MNYIFNFDPILENMPLLFAGAWLTIKISAISIVGSLIIGLLGVYFRNWGTTSVRHIINAYVEFIRNTPFLVQIFFVFFGLPTLGIRLDPNPAAILMLSVNGGAYMIEIIRGGLTAIPKGQVEAGTALGLKQFEVFRYIIAKPALRATYPAACGQFISIVLTSSVAATISASELTSTASQIESLYFVSFEVYVVVLFMYLLISVAFGIILKLIGRLYFRYPSA